MPTMLSGSGKREWRLLAREQGQLHGQFHERTCPKYVPETNIRLRTRSGNISACMNRLIAFHEAGHATAAAVLGMPLEYVSMVPKGDLGEHAAMGALHAPMTTEYLKCMSVFFMAGIVAELLYKQSTDPNEMDEGMDACNRDLVDFSNHKQVFDSLSELSGKPSEDDAIDEATRLIERNWHIVVMIAGVLATHETLSGADVRLIVRVETGVYPKVRQKW